MSIRLVRSSVAGTENKSDTEKTLKLSKISKKCTTTEMNSSRVCLCVGLKWLWTGVQTAGQISFTKRNISFGVFLSPDLTQKL